MISLRPRLLPRLVAPSSSHSPRLTAPPSSPSFPPRLTSPPALPLHTRDSAAALRLPAKQPAKPSRAQLNEGQQEVYDAVVAGRESCFITGNAGTGKSFLLRVMIDALKPRDAASNVSTTKNRRDLAGIKRRKPGGACLISPCTPAVRSTSASSLIIAATCRLRARPRLQCDLYAAVQGTVNVTASTGIAAANISGVTIHSWAGLGLGEAPVEELMGKLSKDAKKRWMNCSVKIHTSFIKLLDGC